MKPQPLSQPHRRRLLQALLVAGTLGIGLQVGQSDARAGLPPVITVAAKPNPGPQSQRIAVVDFRALGCPVSYGEAVAENFRNALVAEHRYVVLERNQIKQAIKEQTFGQSSLVDQTNAVAIGRLIGARYIVVGSITRLGRTYTVNARFIDVQTGEASNARSHSTESEDDLADLVTDLAKDFGAAAEGRPADSGTYPAPGNGRRQGTPGAPNPDTWGREDAPPPAAAPRQGATPRPDPNTWGLEDAPPSPPRKPAPKAPPPPTNQKKPPAKPTVPGKAPQKPVSPSPSPSATPDPATWGLE